MILNSWIRRTSFQMLMLAAVASSVCSAGESSKIQAAKPGSGAPEGCAEDQPINAGCGESGCGEDIDCSTCDYKVLDVNKIFDSVAGDKPVFPCLKDQKVGDLKYSAGAELRYRYMNESNRLRPGGPGHSDYNLWRFTPWVQANYNDFIGGYVQAIDASMFGLDAPYSPTVIDINRTDILQMYAELNLGEVGDGKLKYRYGRQFLQYGSQRLLSPLAWANTFRNFEGHKLMYTSSDWDIDAFSMQSVSAVESMTFKLRSSASRPVICSISWASGFVLGSASMRPSTPFFAIRMHSALISSARSAAAVSVVKNGFPVPPAKTTTRCFSRWRMARRRI